MTNFTTQATLWPPVPADLIDDSTKELLDTCGIACEKLEDGRLYLFSDDGPYNGMSFDEAIQQSVELDYVTVLRGIIARSAGRLKALTIEAADTCNGKMLPDAFGGWAMIITTDKTHYLSTFQWVRKMVNELGLDDAIYGEDNHVDDLG
jgi:hypothetical protein